MMESCASISSESFTAKARHLASTGLYAESFEAYIEAITNYPELRAELDVEFRLVLNKLNEILVVDKKLGDIFSNFERAIDATPGNIYILNDIGKYLYKYGYFKEACCHFQKALYIDSGYVAAERNLNSVKNHLVERWHFRMLNDKIRNESYRKAIHQEIKPKKVAILDLGSGTGIFTVYANERKPSALTAIEASEIMADIASNVFTENKVWPVVLILKMSVSLDYLPVTGKKILLITELFDAGLFGEDVLKTLIHACDHLIIKTAHVLPSRAEFFIAGVKSDYLNKKYQLSSSAKALINMPDTHIHVFTTDPYDCDDLCFVKDLKYMTEPHSLLKVNFNNVLDLHKIMLRTQPYEPKLHAKEAGEINMIVGWFNLHITDNIMITTNPMSDNRANAWQQAVFFDYIPATFEKNEHVPIEFTAHSGKLALVKNYNFDIKRISPEMIQFLNDADYMKMITSCVATVCIYLGQTTEVSNIMMVDLSPFPLFGLQMMKRGAHSLICHAHTKENKKFIEEVFEKNKVDLSKLTILLGNELKQEAFKDQKFHLIVNNILDLCGDVNIHHRQLAQHLRNAHLTQDGLVLPFKISLKGQLVNSKWLDINNRVYDENIGNFVFAKFINIYQVSQNFYLDLDRLEYDAISDPVHIANVNIGMTSEVLNVKVIKDGEANAVLCWYEIEMMEEGDILTTNRASCFMDSMVFLAHPSVKMKVGQMGNIIKCVDLDGAFKLVIDVDA